MSVTSDRVHEIAKATGYGHLTVFCALTPCYQWRAARAIGWAAVTALQWKYGEKPARRFLVGWKEPKALPEPNLEEIFG